MGAVDAIEESENTKNIELMLLHQQHFENQRQQTQLCGKHRLIKTRKTQSHNSLQRGNYENKHQLQPPDDQSKVVNFHSCCKSITEGKHFSTEHCREPQSLELLSAFKSNLASPKPYKDFNESDFLHCFPIVARQCTLRRLFAVLLLISARGHSMQMTRDRSITTVTLTMLAILATASTHVLPASTYEPVLNYPQRRLYNQFDNTEAMIVEDIDVNSNEQQLLAYYKQARQEQQAKKQQNFHHRQRGQDTYLLNGDIELKENRLFKINATKRSTAVKAAISSAATTNFTSTTNMSTTSPIIAEEKCEAKTLDEIPAEPYYDFRDIAEDAARQFTEFLANKFPSAPAVITDQIRDEVRRRANGIASYALSEDDNLLAFALAAPSIHTVVVKFRDNVTIPPDQIHNRGFLGSYWRELGQAWNSSDDIQEWGAPFKDCNLLVGRWLWPFRLSYSESKIKIVAAAFIAADEDVCNDGLEPIFGRRHGCDRNTTFCLLTENKPAATRDVYTCICKESYYLPNSSLQGFRGDIVEMSDGFDNYSCVPCPGGCTTCDSNGACLFGGPQEAVSLESLLKVSVGSILGACILCCMVFSVIVFRQRKSKAIASGMWTVLETILTGIVLLYASVAVHFFPASTERCLTEPWLRELGFITCYGAVILKLYRHLVDFRTRKAHRWVLRDVDLLKYLGTMVFAVVCYMSAFTASSLDLIEAAQLESLREVRTNTCQPLKWEVVTQVSEMLILCFGLHLAFSSRNANTHFKERQFLVAALVIEFLVSSSFYLLRFFYLPVMSPSAIFLALFLRSQLTNTVALALIFVPKLWYQHKQVRSLAHDLSIRLPVDAFKGSHETGQRLGAGYAGLCVGDPDIGELTISEMSPEDIRAELKRLYTQLEILKNKTLRQDNPHISKRRGGRKAGHRRFSLQALSTKHRSNKHHQDIEITEAEPSRSPEDSVCSNDGPTDAYADVSGISQTTASQAVTIAQSK
uniref:G-protein coupled receptors family 3 profile domain-containing protein n=1 Tax=Glossina brevipalpis TaxID=37001 RepID=A0A1A9WMB5_9MUSC